jgi:flagellin
MLSLHTNLAVLSAQTSIDNNQASLSTSMTRLSTGYRINSAMDDAAGLQIASRLKAETSGIKVAMRNAQNSMSMLQIADGALDTSGNMLIRMKDLATQAADAGSTATDKAAMQAEYDALGRQLQQVQFTTSYGGERLLQGGKLAWQLDFQIGASSSEVMQVDMLSTFGGGGANSVDTALAMASAKYMSPWTTAAGTELTNSANATIGLLDKAIDKTSEARSMLGALANRLGHVYDHLANVGNNTQQAAGRIMDIDFATESANMAAAQMLVQSGTAMLKQGSSMQGMIVSLLQP